MYLDKDWLFSKLELVYDTDHRCKHIDLTSDWYYVDDCTDKFFPAQHGEVLYLQQLGSRILLTDPHGSGEDILE